MYSILFPAPAPDPFRYSAPCSVFDPASRAVGCLRSGMIGRNRGSSSVYSIGRNGCTIRGLPGNHNRKKRGRGSAYLIGRRTDSNHNDNQQERQRQIGSLFFSFSLFVLFVMEGSFFIGNPFVYHIFFSITALGTRGTFVSYIPLHESQG